MHIVFLNQYMPPDSAPTGIMLDAVAQECAERGHDVTVIASRGGYNTKTADLTQDHVNQSNYNLISVKATDFGRLNFAGKLIDYLSFYFLVFYQLLTLSKTPTKIVSLTTPPYLSILARLCSKLRGATHAHWIMDLYPEVLFSHQILKKSSFPGYSLKKLAQWGFGGQRNQGVLTLGPDMHSLTSEYVSAHTEREWIPLWASSLLEVSQEDIHTWRNSKGWSEETLVLMYSGNMGLGHYLEEFLQASLRFMSPDSPDIRFVFCGKGKRRHEVEDFLEKNPNSPVELLEPVALDCLNLHLSSADVHLASLRDSWTGSMVPSKVQGVFSIGRPLIFIGSSDSSPSLWIEESQAGWSVLPQDVNGLVQVIHEACDSKKRICMNKSAKDFSKKAFDPISNIKAVTEFFLSETATSHSHAHL